jgi:hypothetical protein
MKLEADDASLLTPDDNAVVAPVLTARSQLQGHWSRIARSKGSASIYISNDIDDEPIPSSIDPTVFIYDENDRYFR